MIADDQAHPTAAPVFTVTMRGYDRAQVEECLAQLRTELRLFAADRDAALSQAAELTDQLTKARAIIEDLTNKLEQATIAAPTRQETPDQAARRLRLAETRASEMLSGAEAATEAGWAKAEQTAAQLRQRYQHFLSELDRYQAEITAEYRGLLGKAKVATMQLTKDADERRQKLDAQAEERRRQLEQAFEQELAEKRATLRDKLAADEIASAARIERQTQESIAKAEQSVREHQEHTARLTGLRGQVVDQLRSADELLTQAGPLLEPLAQERE